MRASLVVSTSVIALSLLACGGAAKRGAKSASNYDEVDPFGDGKGGSSSSASSESASTPSAPASTPAPSSSPGKRDPKVMALAKKAFACKFGDDGTFDENCPGFTQWKENEEAFEDGKGNDTIFSMLGDADEKVRVLASTKSISEPKTFFADKGRAQKLFALAKDQPEASREVGGYVAVVDAERLGLGNELKALAKHPSTPFRRGLASVITHHQSPAAVAAIGVLLGDREPSVQEDAINALSTGGVTPASEAVCALFVKQLARPDKLGAVALNAASSSKCPGMDAQVVFELQKRTSDPKKVTNAVGVSYALAASGVCTRTQTADLKKKGFAVGKKLADASVPDVNTRKAALAVLTDCDPAAAATAIKPLTKDKDKTMSEGAKKALDQLRAKTAK